MLSIVVPTYNERDNVLSLIKEIEKNLYGQRFEIIIVDDNSPDKTWSYAAQLCSLRKVVVIRRLNMRGLASAVIDGISFSRGEYVAVMDADLQHPPEYLRNMLNIVASEHPDLVIGSRYVPGASIESWSLTRSLISRIATLLAKLLLPEVRNIKDPMSGFFVVRKELVTVNKPKLKPYGYKVLLEILVRCNPKKVIEVPYIFRSRQHGKSKLSTKVMVEYIIHLLKLSSWRPLKFAFVGALGTVINLTILYLLGLLIPRLLGRLFILGSAIAIEGSMLFNFTLHELWTFRDRRGGPMIHRLVLYHLGVLPAVLVQYITAVGLKYLLSMNPFMAQLIGIFMGFIVNYLICELGIWTKKSV